MIASNESQSQIPKQRCGVARAVGRLSGEAGRSLCETRRICGPFPWPPQKCAREHPTGVRPHRRCRHQLTALPHLMSASEKFKKKATLIYINLLTNLWKTNFEKISHIYVAHFFLINVFRSVYCVRHRVEKSKFWIFYRLIRFHFHDFRNWISVPWTLFKNMLPKIEILTISIYILHTYFDRCQSDSFVLDRQFDYFNYGH